ncbi:hypothetical protein ZYGR_0H00880 [Zygosaccharomyces rouxii]|uniref:Uncharacterized protein n=1 Tax=Zygosaccharomyces rouxii TaxID=4956 RepID=A0A1Q2ZUV9_ZYGRO|nr:hypothetical protein ZYGR_0H00880 [Zygosaccharomyces rouxii]
MSELTVSYGLLPPQGRSSQNLHILPISKILYPYDRNDCFITCGRDGSVIRHLCTPEGVSIGGVKVQAHSDWVSDIIQVDIDSYVTVSYDFSIVLLTWKPALGNWETKIIGDHEDYIKCIVGIPTTEEDCIMFATGGLDKKVKVWKMESKSNGAECIRVFDNIQANDTGSIYTMDSVGAHKNLPFDLIIGDGNGDLIFYSSKQDKEFSRVKNIHFTNMKVVKMFDDYTRLVSTCSDGLICIWDLTEVTSVLKILASFKWDCSIWCIEGNSLEELYVGDSKGRITKSNFSNIQNVGLEVVYEPQPSIEETNEDTRSQSSTKPKKKHVGILCINWLRNNYLLFSQSVDSNLNRLDLSNNTLAVAEGGIALTKSSLLTNRRHVITENTKGEIQRWDIVVCELLDTFDPSEGNFDQVVSKYTSREVLSHWCSVSVKVGLLFVKLNQRLLNTEVYGSSLKEYHVVNGLKPNPDERYNLGKIVANSLFNELVMYEMHKDKVYRLEMVSKKKNSSFFHNETSNSTESPLDTKRGATRRKSAFHRLNTNAGQLATERCSPSTSAPNSPFLQGESPLPVDDKPFLGPPAFSDRGLTTRASSNASSNDANSDSGYNPPHLKTTEARTTSSGSLFGRKLRLFKTTSARALAGSSGSNDSNYTSAVSDAEESAVDDDTKDTSATSTNTVNTTTTSTHAPAETVVWNSELSTDSVPLPQPSDTTKPTSTSAEPAESEQRKKSREESMSDLIEQFHDNYRSQVSNNTSTLKMLSRKPPHTKIIRDACSPIIRVTNGVLIVLHSWQKGSCGGRVLFSTYLPPARNDEYVKTLEKVDGDESEDFEDTLGEPLQQERVIEEKEKLSKEEWADREFGNGSNRRQIYEQLENILPFWFSKTLLCDSKVVKQQPKLNFVITPWRGSNDQATVSQGSSQGSSQQQQPSSLQHYKMKFGRSGLRSNDTLLGTTDLPKVSETNLKLLAPAMIKVKKIKVYIVDRFETKTPEMRNKIEPSEWLELLCKGQILDNDMTLSTVRTLYWKSQGDIVFEYRRKTSAPSAI